MTGSNSDGTLTPSEVTGRDEFILTQALATAFALIGTLPSKCQEMSNRHDMALLLQARLGADWKIQAHFRRHVLTSGEWHNGKGPLARDTFEDIDC